MATDAASREDENIAATLRACLLSVLGPGIPAELLQDDTNLFDIGIDSMNMTELLLLIEQRFHLTLSPGDLSADLFSRLANLTAFVRTHASRG